MCPGDPGDFSFLTKQLRELVVINDETTADPTQGSHAVDRITLDLHMNAVWQLVHSSVPALIQR